MTIPEELPMQCQCGCCARDCVECGREAMPDWDVCEKCWDDDTTHELRDGAT